jgi:hypothetical protein
MESIVTEGTNMRLSTLSFVDRWASPDGHISRSVLVDGLPLEELVDPDVGTDMNWQSAIDRLRRLQPVADTSNRIGIGYCDACGDIFCGVTTARVEVRGDVVEWHDLGFDSVNWEAFVRPRPRPRLFRRARINTDVSGGTWTTTIVGATVISFDRRQYEQSLLDELHHQGTMND